MKYVLYNGNEKKEVKTLKDVELTDESKRLTEEYLKDKTLVEIRYYLVNGKYSVINHINKEDIKKAIEYNKYLKEIGKIA